MAFNTMKIGKRITKLRKEKNMTQMEQADALGVSYQAVSNWERGNSMPDISKLPDLVELLGCSIDELLSDSDEIDLIKHVIEGDAKQFIMENEVSLQDIGDIAPILKPRETEELTDQIIERNDDKLPIEELLSIAPFIDQDYLEKLVDRVEIVEHIESLCGLAPFLSERALDKLAEKLQKRGQAFADRPAE